MGKEMEVSPRPSMTKVRALLIVLAVFPFAGCSGRPKNVARSVTGKVTVAGQPLAGARVIFTPKEGGSPSMGKTDDQGKYKLSWSRGIDGAQIGEHTVTISTLVEGPPSANPPKPEVPEKVPLKYRENPPTAEVKRGSNVINFDMEAGPTEAPPPPKGKKGKK
jgi:hypothetical protein